MCHIFLFVPFWLKIHLQFVECTLNPVDFSHQGKLIDFFSGTPVNKAPAIVNKDLNLYRLFKVVQNIGGYNKVSRSGHLINHSDLFIFN